MMRHAIVVVAVATLTVIVMLAAQQGKPQTQQQVFRPDAKWQETKGPPILCPQVPHGQVCT